VQKYTPHPEKEKPRQGQKAKATSVNVCLLNAVRFICIWLIEIIVLNLFVPQSNDRAPSTPTFNPYPPSDESFFGALRN